jgi:glucokinase
MYLGIEIGGTKLQLALGDPKCGKIEQIFRYQVQVEKGAEGILAQIEDCIQQIPGPLQGIGVGFGGPVDRIEGKIATSHQIGGWSGFELKKWLETLSSVRVLVDNDANVAALAEAFCGAGQGFQRVFYITLGSGVGGGMVIDGQLYHGQTPGEAEIGQLRMNLSGETLESFCSGWALDAKIRSLAPGLPETSILKKLLADQKGGEAKCLLHALEAQDPLALDILDSYATHLAWGLSHAVHLFHPEVLVLGGGVSLIGSPLQQAIAAKLPGFLVPSFRPGPQVRLAALKEEAVLVGALVLMG